LIKRVVGAYSLIMHHDSGTACVNDGSGAGSRHIVQTDRGDVFGHRGMALNLLLLLLLGIVIIR